MLTTLGSTGSFLGVFVSVCWAPKILHLGHLSLLAFVFLA